MNKGIMKTTARVGNVLPEVQQVAWEMRRQMTSAEAALWAALGNRQLDGLRWRAQHPVGRFVLDFYCPACKLVVELDGAGHDTERDAACTAILETHGCRVLRFPNEDVLNNLPSVLEYIRQAAEKQEIFLAPPELGAGGASAEGAS